MKLTTILVCSIYLAFAFAKHAKMNLEAQRDLHTSAPSDNAMSDLDSSLRPPPYMNSLINQVLDLKGGGHMNYLNVYPSSWTTNQVNSELTVDVSFTAVVNSQSQRCTAHISASMPPTSDNDPTIIPAGSTLTCTGAGTTGGMGYMPQQGGGNNGYPYPPNPYRDPYRESYHPPQGPQIVYSTKYVPTWVATVVPPAYGPRHSYGHVVPSPYAPHPYAQVGPPNPYAHVPQNPYLHDPENLYGQVAHNPYPMAGGSPYNTMFQHDAPTQYNYAY